MMPNIWTIIKMIVYHVWKLLSVVFTQLPGYFFSISCMLNFERLVWYQPPFPASSFYILINELDLNHPATILLLLTMKLIYSCRCFSIPSTLKKHVFKAAQEMFPGTLNCIKTLTLFNGKKLPSIIQTYMYNSQD